MIDVEPIVTQIVDSAVKLHMAMGPGLLESVYKRVLVADLERRGFTVEREVPVAFEFDGLLFEDGLRVDLLVNKAVVVEVKAVEQYAPVHLRQLYTYLKLLRLPVGLLINFGAATLKAGLRRVVCKYDPSPSSPLRINKQR